MPDNGIAVERLWSVREAAEYLGLAEGTIRNKAQAGEIPFERIGSFPGGRLRFRKSELDRWMGEQKVA